MPRSYRHSGKPLALVFARERTKARRAETRSKIPPERWGIPIVIENVDVRTNAFLRTRSWRTVRYHALVKAKGRCQACGRSKKDHGVTLNVDHIMPRELRPDLALDPENLQVLCEDCNIGKGNTDTTDWR